MWVCLRTNQSIVKHGEMHHYRPGDWVDIGRQIAQGWIDAGIAYIVDPEQLAGTMTYTSGVAVRGVLSDSWRERLAQIDGLQVAFYDDLWTHDLPFTETLIWKPDFDLRLDLMKVGFDLLKRWQVAVPLFDYTTLAAQVGTADERERTKAVIRDLRVPLRDTRLIFVRRCDDTRALMAEWIKLTTPNSDERLSFLQALYTVKPVVCDLPCSWTGKQA